MAPMTLLLRRMLDTMTLRNLSPGTQQSKICAVARFVHLLTVRAMVERISAGQEKMVGTMKILGFPTSGPVAPPELPCATGDCATA